ncbi:MAG TPA: DsbA family protein [Noviherbaspirillum sp.]|jgi:putative protein-disulfide isomerase|uniref:DsbA family protein n=1 Tax=Noviherbaspirillum sp. TaxID=1926288 RepID=UPI002F9229B0
MASLIYIADPMCSWCYGFGPELASLQAGLPGLPVHVVTGGLRAYNRQPADDTFRNMLRGHWEEVAARTGLPFTDTGMTGPGFVYDTEPACRAVVAARLLSPSAALPVFTAVQRAFYVDGRDVTSGETLAAVALPALEAAGVKAGAGEFIALWGSEAAVRATGKDFQQTQRWGVNGFPALVLERDGKLDLVTLGYLQMPLLVERMQAVLDAAPADDAPAA